MKGFFLNSWLYRLISPWIWGAIAYTLVLLLNNNVEQLQSQFLGEELYLFVAIAAVSQELLRLYFIVIERLKLQGVFKIIVQTSGAFSLTIASTSALLSSYFKWVVGFSADSYDLLIFNVVFVFISSLYLVLFLSHLALKNSTATQLEMAQRLKQETEANFRDFKRALNPELLFESLEQVVLLLKQNPVGSEELLQQVSTLYRYTLGGKRKQLVTLAEEWHHWQNFIILLNALPKQTVKLHFLPLNQSQLNGIWLVPTALLQLSYFASRQAIAGKNNRLNISLQLEENHLVFGAQSAFKIEDHPLQKSLKHLKQQYAFFSNVALGLSVTKQAIEVRLPIIKNNSHASSFN
jgi:hypothetical protein